MALTLFRRHLKRCPQKDRYFRRCACPIHVEGTLGGEEVRKGLKLMSWEAAQELVGEWNRAGKVGGTALKSIELTEGVELYLQDVAARVRPSTVRLHRVLLKDSFLPWCQKKGIRYLRNIEVKHIIEYRASWTYAPMTALKKFERLRSFLKFCEEAGWIQKNPAKALKPPKADTPPTLPFSDEEVERIFRAAAEFNIRGSYGRNNATRVLAFVYVLRYAGLRISDAAGLAKDRLQDGKLFLHMQRKTRVPVFVPLPPFVVAALEEQSKHSAHPDYFFWTGVGSIESACSSWKRTLYRIYELANVPEGHAHRFRDSFATSLLLKGVPIEVVSQLLGHQNIAVTQRSYSPWIKARQDALESAVRLTWPEPKIKLVTTAAG